MEVDNYSPRIIKKKTQPPSRKVYAITASFHKKKRKKKVVMNSYALSGVGSLLTFIFLCILFYSIPFYTYKYSDG